MGSSARARSTRWHTWRDGERAPLESIAAELDVRELYDSVETPP
ncbi:MAG TPA: hypothetical protein VFS67_01585 [Polyangiaceae bacterium]|nr:hypothetical protein [Polyangiaceae bacterium]